MKRLNSLVITGPNTQVDLSADEKSKAAAYLLENSPIRNDAHAERELQKIFNFDLNIKKDFVCKSGDWKNVITSIERPRGITEDQIVRSRKSLTLASSSGKKSTISIALNKLSAQSTTYESDKEAMTMKINSYCSDLSQYPIDAVLEAIDSGWEIFPPFETLRKKVSEYASERSTMLRIVSAWKPWSKDDEITDLKSRLERATFDSKYFAVDGPQKHTERAEKAKEAIPRIEKLLVELTGEEIDRRTDEEIKLAHDKLKDDAEKLKELEAQAQRDKIEQFIKDSKLRVAEHEHAATAAEINGGKNNE